MTNTYVNSLVARPQAVRRPSRSVHRKVRKNTWPSVNSGLEAYLKELPGNVLVAWDAPLTGPPDPESWTNGQDLTIRKIERFFRNDPLYKVPKGISVLGYSGCSHWTITRRLLGLHRVG